MYLAINILLCEMIFYGPVLKKDIPLGRDPATIVPLCPPTIARRIKGVGFGAPEDRRSLHQSDDIPHLVFSQKISQTPDGWNEHVIDDEQAALLDVWVEKQIFELGKRVAMWSIEQDDVVRLVLMVRRKGLLCRPKNERNVFGYGQWANFEKPNARFLPMPPVVDREDPVIR